MTVETGAITGRQSNTLPLIVERYKAGKILSAGDSAKVLHLVEDPVRRVQLRKEILEAQKTYWRNWWEFRCMPAGKGNPNFDDVVRLLPVRREFAHFVDPQDNTLLIDLMAGSANMAPYFQETKKLAGYIGIDSNDLIEEVARGRLARSGIKRAGFILHDLSQGLPEDKLSKEVHGENPDPVQYASMWGITYLDAERFTDLVKQCLGSKFNEGRGAIPDLSFCMITDGRFDPQVLRKKFMGEIFPRELKGLHFSRLIRAMRALPQMKKFGDSFREVSPIWYPNEIGNLLEKVGLHIDKIDDTLLWGQSTAIKVSAS